MADMEATVTALRGALASEIEQSLATTREVLDAHDDLVTDLGEERADQIHASFKRIEALLVEMREDARATNPDPPG